MQGEAQLKVATVLDEAFAGVQIGDFVIAAAADIHVGTRASDPPPAPACVFRASYTEFNAPVRALGGLAGNLVTASVQPVDAQIDVAGTLMSDANVTCALLTSDEVAAPSVRIGDVQLVGGAPGLRLRTADGAADSGITVSHLLTDRVIVSTVAPLDPVAGVLHTGSERFLSDLRAEAGFTSTTGATLGDGALATCTFDAPEGQMVHADQQPAALSFRSARLLEAHGDAGVQVSCGERVGAWDVAYVNQCAGGVAAGPGVTRARAHVLARADGGGSVTESALAASDDGTLAAVRVDNGAFARPAPLRAGALQLRADDGQGADMSVRSGDGQISVSRTLAAPGLLVADDAGQHASIVHAADRLVVDTVIDVPGLDIGTCAVRPTVAGGLDVDRQLNCPGLRVVEEADRWFEMRADATTSAVRVDVQSGASCYLLPTATALELSPPALRLKYEAGGTTGYVELEGSSQGLQLNTDRITLGGGAGIAAHDAERVELVNCASLALGDRAVLDVGTPDTLAVSSRTLAIGPDSERVEATVESRSCLLLGPDDACSVRAAAKITLQAADAVVFRMRDGADEWRDYALASRADGALTLNGQDLEALPRDSLAGAHDGGAAGPWWRSVTGVQARFPAAAGSPTELPRLLDFQFYDGAARGSSLTYTNGFAGYAIDYVLPLPAVLRRAEVPPLDSRRFDARPAAWRVYGTSGLPTGTSVWEELGRGGVQDNIECATVNAYDAYRVAVNSITAGERIETTGVRLWTLAPAQNVPAQHSFTGRHLVVPFDGDLAPFRPGMVVVVDPDNVGLDSIAEGGFKERGSAAAITVDSALPFVALSRRPRDPTVYGVVSGITRNRWYTAAHDWRLQVNGLGEGAVLVCDEAGPISAGDLLCTATEPGHAMRQEDDIVRSCTLGKATMACSFLPPDVPVQEAVRTSAGGVAWARRGGKAPLYTCTLLPSGGQSALLACVYLCS
jgi:hypothetical protein